MLLAQLPNLVNLFSPWGAQRQANRSNALVSEMKKLDRAAKSGEFDANEHVRRQNELIEKQKLVAREEDNASAQQWAEMVRLGNMVLPVGWLPLGVMAGAEGRVLPSILGLLGMAWNWIVQPVAGLSHDAGTVFRAGDQREAASGTENGGKAGRCVTGEGARGRAVSSRHACPGCRNRFRRLPWPDFARWFGRPRRR